MRQIDLQRTSVARAKTVRYINRQIVLNYVRERGPISRAEIAHETELQRSTVSQIANELKGAGLIEEVSGESSGGRPPILLSLRTEDAVAIGVDLGTARTIVATSDLAGRMLEHAEFVTEPDAVKTVRKICEITAGLVRQHRGTVEGIGITLPGLVDQEAGKMYIPYFKWRDLNIADEVRAATGLPVTIDNDANAAALAELWFGRPEIRGVRDFVMVLVEEGVGTGVVFDGQVYRGKGAAAGEFGHMTIGTGAPVACASGSRECWEAFSSERAALARYAKLARNGGSGDVDCAQLVDRALRGEGTARAALKETGRYLGIGIANLIQGLAPEVVIVGGPIVRAWELLAPDIRKAVDANICQGLPSTRVIASTLGEQPTLMGAVSLVLTSKFASASII